MTCRKDHSASSGGVAKPEPPITFRECFDSREWALVEDRFRRAAATGVRDSRFLCNQVKRAVLIEAAAPALQSKPNTVELLHWLAGYIEKNPDEVRAYAASVIRDTPREVKKRPVRRRKQGPAKRHPQPGANLPDPNPDFDPLTEILLPLVEYSVSEWQGERRRRAGK